MIYRYPSGFHFLNNVIKICPNVVRAGGLGFLGLRTSRGSLRTDVGFVPPPATVSACRYSRSPRNESQQSLQYKKMRVRY